MGEAASAALHSSDMVAIRFLSLPILNWPFLIFSANSISANGDRRIVESFEPEHRSDPLFDSPVVLFEPGCSGIGSIGLSLVGGVRPLPLVPALRDAMPHRRPA